MDASEAAGTTAPGTAAAGLTTGALARRLGVSPTTLRSWDRRYGIGPAVRTGGRHRRWTPEDVTVLETMCRLTASGVPPAEAARAARRKAHPAAARRPADTAPAPAPAPAAQAAAGTVPTLGTPEPGVARQDGRGLARAAVRLDAAAVDERLEAAVARYGVVTAWQEVMVPTLHAVGRRWASAGDPYVAVEHLLSWHVSTTLRRHTRPSAAPAETTGPGPVLLACVPGEQHTLPLEALNAALTHLGIPVRMFGGAVPAEALLTAVRRLGPAAVVLWAQARSTASPPLAARVAAQEWGVRGARTQALVMLGGPGWAGRPTRGMLRPTALSDALDTLAARYRTALPGPLSRGSGPA
ncbi:transcriptional regulator [Streptomyces sp. FBKL.4005]|uniref:MerR family transcriptional regulator n=1 Tax=Streptomyces sp. FBKL.4005 TaxID=2015515 RepID=UPI000B9621AF|nr:MerR family transcriptional regulator [Streptomyces sp. FBKL.4005]OYP19563.1 transcriptional regulator [Streptomyces sp. FBKL.4005]